MRSLESLRQELIAEFGTETVDRWWARAVGSHNPAGYLTGCARREREEIRTGRPSYSSWHPTVLSRSVRHAKRGRRGR